MSRYCPLRTGTFEILKESWETHWEVVKRVFCYLKGTQDLWLTYGRAREELARFADTDGNYHKWSLTVCALGQIIT